MEMWRERGEERRGGSGNTGNNPNLTIQSFTFCNGVDKNYFLFVFVFMYIYFMPGTAQLSKIGSCLTQASNICYITKQQNVYELHEHLSGGFTPCLYPVFLPVTCDGINE